MVEDDAKVTLTVTMSPEDYIRLKKNAEWEGQKVSTYLVEQALGRNGRGC